MKTKQLLLILTALFGLNSYACPIAQNLTDVEENWELTLVSKHEQTVIYDSYNYVSDINDNKELTTIALLTSDQIQKDDKIPVLFNRSSVYKEDGNAIDRSVEGVGAYKGKLIRVDITMNDKKDAEITLGELINHISDDFKVECRLKESVRFNNSNTENIKSSVIQQ